MQYMICRTNELYHHGIKGMKWGIRRFQRKDGSLTPAGEKRRARLEAKLEKLGGKKSGVSSPTPSIPRKKKLSEMTDEEVREATNRMRIEKEYHDSQHALAAANPVKVSAGKRFIKSVLNDVVAPAAKNAGKAWAEDFMKDKLGLNKKSELGRLEEQWKKLDYKKKIKDLERGIEDDPNEELKKKHDRLDLEKKIEKLEKGEPSIGELIDRYNNMSSEERKLLETAANVRFYEEALKNKGVKPDKGKKDKDKDDDDD